MNRLSTTEARETFADLVNTVSYRKERVIVTRRGKAIAAVVPVEDLETLENAEDRHDIEAAELAKTEGPPIPWESIKEQLGLQTQ